MSLNYKRTTYILAIALAISLSVTLRVLAGNTDSPGAPTDPASQMYTLEDIYNRLASNGDATKMTAFEEPAAGPGSTMHTLDDIYALARPARVQVTGQTLCYDTTGTTIPCAGTGQDGELQKGIAWPNPRFTINGDGTVTDNLTGLVWLADADCLAAGWSWGWTTWEGALTAANTLADGTCGLTDGSVAGDWRLPNVREITSLLHYGYDHLSIPNTAGTGQWAPGDPFTNVRTAYYWTSTSYSDDPSNAWRVGAGISTLSHSAKTDANSIVWPVRDGQ